jgi:ribA/ribD-fused uncharacterized protein
MSIVDELLWARYDIRTLTAERDDLRRRLDSTAMCWKQCVGSNPNRAKAGRIGDDMNHGLDTDEQVFFYEQDFYVLSNFSAFKLRRRGFHFDTSESAYHWEKFTSQGDPDDDRRKLIRDSIITADSAHDAFGIARAHVRFVRLDWNEVKVRIMREILRMKVEQHEYVGRKLLATGQRVLVENSWRDDFWGWGPDRTGQNMLGKLWMEIRTELREREEVK